MPGALHGDDSTFVRINFPRILANGTATQPMMIGQPANPQWTMRARPTARQYCKMCLEESTASQSLPFLKSGSAGR